MSLADARALAERCGFDLLRGLGEGTQYFWLWFLKPRFPWIPRGLRGAFHRAVERRVSVTFSCERVRAGHTYRVSIPALRGQIVDIAYELTTDPQLPPVCGFVGRWCVLDERGEAEIAVPAGHPEGTVRITQVRSRTRGSRWHRAGAIIHVATG
jgi:hypothetical protein